MTKKIDPTKAKKPTVQAFQIEISPRPTAGCSHPDHITTAAHQLGLTAVESCTSHRLFFIQGHLTLEDVTNLADRILADPVTETYQAFSLNIVREKAAVSSPANQPPTATIEVTLLPGVTDPPGENFIKAAHHLGLEVIRAASGQRYQIQGHLTDADLQRLATEVLSNPVIQRISLNNPILPPFFSSMPTDYVVETIPVREASTDALNQISTERRLALNLTEMQAIQTYFQGEDRDPTDVELEMLAQTWSEHCVHKTFKATIYYTGPEPGQPPQSPAVRQVIPGILKTTLRHVTDTLAKPWVHSAFVDNAGIIAFDQGWDLAFKVETHNHPSALEPFGGANTGIGGVIRDILGVSARPIANTDVLCFGPPDLSPQDLPAGVLHPQRIADGVVHGVEDYGNKMGIPTVNGAILYHTGYTANPLVYCGCLGLLPHNSHPTTPQPDDLIVVLGGRTGRDGLRGATFSSLEMDETTSDVSGSAVQIGHPINEKQVLEVIVQARDEHLYHAITDCGAGGLSSAVGEMTQSLGGTVQLHTVPLKYPGLQPWEIWLSEAQERMVLAVGADAWLRLQEICAGHDVEAICIGQFNTSGRLQLFYQETLVGDIHLDFLHDGIPLGELEAIWQPPLSATTPAATTDAADDLKQILLTLLAHPNIRSKEDVIRRYDHEIQGGTVVKPLVGLHNQGPSDATVLLPINSQLHQPDPQFSTLGQVNTKGVALSAGICPGYGLLDPYAMAWAAIDEAIRNAVAVGADPDQIALLDNFCWGNPNLPDRLGSLVRCAQGCHDAALAYGAPFISGKDSLNNEYTAADGQKHAIPGTLLISVVGIVPDKTKTTTMPLKQVGNLLYIVGQTKAELGGSHYQLITAGETGLHGMPPQPVTDALQDMRRVHQAITAGLVEACHDCSEGGLGVALAEMCLAGGLGATLDLNRVPIVSDVFGDGTILFTESLSRFIIEVTPAQAAAFESTMADTPHARVGQVTAEATLQVQGHQGDTVLTVDLTSLDAAWRGHLTAGASISLFEVTTPASTLSQPYQSVNLSTSPRVIILHANGINRDRDAALACQLAGGQPDIVHINQLLNGERMLQDYHMLIVPGGFSYGDDLGAGTLWAFTLTQRLREMMHHFVASGRPVLGICNGFQTLVKAGFLPGLTPPVEKQTRCVTLAPNASGKFECRWVYLQPNSDSPSLFTQGLSDPIYCPVAHGEGRVAVADEATLAAIQTQNLNTLTYVNQQGQATEYPVNPNGSILNIAGLCNPAGNVLGLMPHPENHIFPWQHPRFHHGHGGWPGLRLFENGLKAG